METRLSGSVCRIATLLAGVLASLAALSADFHAVGHEPDWQLDIDYTSRQLDFTAAEGAGSYRFAKLGPDLTRGDIKAITYRVVDDDHHMSVVVLEMFCQDMRSGKAYGATVNVRLDGREYVGCGEPVVERSTDPW
jgi:putative lipoprotein